MAGAAGQQAQAQAGAAAGTAAQPQQQVVAPAAPAMPFADQAHPNPNHLEGGAVVHHPG